MLSTKWKERKSAYDVVVIGSGYGGAISAARMATAGLNPTPSICILERGREWQPGEFPESFDGVVAQTRSDLNPLGLYELLNYPDISVIKGSGLGGTSLINANVAIVPDREVFEHFQWPSAIDLLPTYSLITTRPAGAGRRPAPARPVPRQSAGARAPRGRTRLFGGGPEYRCQLHCRRREPLRHRAEAMQRLRQLRYRLQRGAKNTLYMNYLPMARNAGPRSDRAKAEWLEKLPAGGWRIHGTHLGENGGESFTLDAGDVILSAGALNSTEILLRSEMHGLPVSPALGTRFSGNGDFFGLAYNGDYETDVLGYPAASPACPGDSPAPGPNIVGIVRYAAGRPGAAHRGGGFLVPRGLPGGAKALSGPSAGRTP